MKRRWHTHKNEYLITQTNWRQLGGICFGDGAAEIAHSNQEQQMRYPHYSFLSNAFCTVNATLEIHEPREAVPLREYLTHSASSAGRPLPCFVGSCHSGPVTPNLVVSCASSLQILLPPFGLLR